MRLILCASLVGLASGMAAGQEVALAWLPFAGGQTAGPNATDYPSATDRDLWVIEDFGVANEVSLGRFETQGTVFPGAMFVTDVNVRIYDAMPPDGHIVLASVPGQGTVNAAGVFSTTFGGQYLPAGSYFIVWNMSTQGTSIAIMWAQAGAHAVGGGLPDNAWLWNPGGGWGYPNNIKKVPADLQGNGQTGVNFKLMGDPVLCYANCDGSIQPPILNANDFQCFINLFAQGAGLANCDGSTAAPTLNVNDFQCFLNRFAVGCT